jgi:hypothetical protein
MSWPGIEPGPLCWEASKLERSIRTAYVVAIRMTAQMYGTHTLRESSYV